MTIRALFLPAIKLTNRLSYTAKFALLGFMSMVAIAVVVYSLYASLEQVVRSSQRELAGRKLLPFIAQTVRLMQQHRGRSAAVVGGNSAMRDARAAMELETETAFSTMEAQLPASLTGGERYQRIKTGWETLRQEGLSWTVAENFEAHTRLINQLLLFMATVADEYALTLDPDIDSYYLIDSTVIKLPMAIEQLGQIRAYGSGILAAKRISVDQKVTMRTLVASLDNALESLAFNLEKTGRYNPSIQNTLTTSSREITDSVGRIIERVNSDILLEKFSTAPEAFFTMTTTEIDKIYELINDTLSRTADALIQARIERAQTALRSSVGIAAALFLLVIYFSVGIYLAIIGNIQSLARSARAFADGDMQQRIRLNTHDELGQVGDSFNEMAQGFTRLLVAQQEDENRLRAIIGTTLDAVVQMNHEGKISGWNAQAEKIFGWQQDEAIGRLLHETIIPPGLRDTHVRGLEHFLATGVGPILNSRIEVSALHRLGHEFLAELTVTAVVSEGRQAFCAFIRDITERKQAELLLQQSDLRFRTLFELSPDPVWIIDGGRFVQCNQAAAAILGYRSKEEILNRHPAQLSPDRQPDGEDSFAKAERMMAIAMEQGINRFEWLHTRVDGSALPVEVTLSAFSLQGRPVIYCIWRDMSEHKQAEASMRLAVLVYQNSNEAMAVTNADGEILDVNPAFTQITGYTLEEVIGKNPRILSSGQHEPSFYQAMWRAINTTGRWQGEIWNRRKSGEVYAEWLSINSIFGEDGSVQRRVALFSDITERKQSEELIWKQANFDTLTGLPNRRMFRDRLDQEIKKAHRSGRLLALMYLDLDHFKEVNDTLGHDMGDSLLKDVAKRLHACVRETDTVARMGGDEFTVILGSVDNADSVERVAQAILQTLAEPFPLADELAYVSASIGITLYPEDALDIEGLLKNADQAMYAAKRQGRNGYCFFTPAMQKAAQARRQLIGDLHSALAGRQFWLAYQPIVDLASGEIHKAEALIRWRHPSRGMVSPAEFIPVAEDTGLILAIGDWVFREATQQVARWRAAHHPSFQVSVNKSPAQFRNERDNQRSWPDHLQSAGLSGDSIVVEITEGLLLDTDAIVMEQFLVYRDAGMQVAIDDFGTGYSSLSYLKKFDIDYLKIDQSFVRNLAAGSSDMALCEAIIVMAHKLGIKVIAEGVETQAQRELLAAAGCDYGQGYLFARPMPAEEFDALLSAGPLSGKTVPY